METRLGLKSQAHRSKRHAALLAPNPSMLGEPQDVPVDGSLEDEFSVIFLHECFRTAEDYPFEQEVFFYG